MRFFVLVMAVSLLSGCATSPAPSDKVRSDPSGRVSGYQKQVPEDSSLIVTSDTGALGAGCFATIFLNGMPVAKLYTGDKVVVQVPPGEWLLGATLDGAARCAANPERIETSVVLKQGQQKKIKVFLPADGGSLTVQQSSF